ncbi:MAG: hypothetical protein KKA07_18440 [Bacteroidetes bacterium]|nr:hypothetical protein [Bacteroidota bacterium]MBU1721051.1 hypothetical protein [Bacteroidota bacterium]
MWYIAIIITLAAGIIIGVKTGIFSGSSEDAEEIKIGGTDGNIENDSIKPLYSKAQIEKKLKQLAEAPPPDSLSFGAMCYSMAMPPETGAYVCPVCGEKTLYNRDNYESWFRIEELLSGDIAACRSQVKYIKGINIALDESQFCKKCSPDVKNPQLCLLVNIDQTSDTTKVCGIGYSDVQILGEFLNGSLVHHGERDSREPLADRITRIQQLLGVSIKQTLMKTC